MASDRFIPGSPMAPKAAPAAPRVKIDLRPIFATPVAVVPVPNAERFNVALTETILDRERTSPGVQHSNLGGWQSDTDFAEWCGAAGQELLAFATTVATSMTCDRQGRPVKPAWRRNAWANVNRQGHGNEFHTHPGSYWSASYYVQDGGTSAGDVGGEFEMADPRGAAPAMYAPHLAFNHPGGLSAGVSELIVPRAGLLVMFPSWLSHQVRPYTGGEVRISIAMNFSL